MLKTKVAVLVSGNGTNLQAIIDAEKRGEIPFGELALVVSNKADAYALKRAEAAGIDVKHIPFPSKESFEAEFKKLLTEYGIELIVMAGFMRVLSENFIKSWANRIINVHPSLIPSFCGDGFFGLKVHQAALDYGVKVTGATVHFVNEITDGGEIIAQRAVDIKKGDTPETLQKRVMEEAEWIIFPLAVAEISEKLQQKREELPSE